MSMQLRGRLALITGAGAGIGRALALRAADEGMNVVLAGRNEAALQETRAQHKSLAAAPTIAADIATAAGRALLSGFVRQAYGRLDLLIHNAGVQQALPVESIADDAIDRMVQTNLLAPMALTRDLLPALRAGAPSRVMFIGSMFGDIGFPLFASYSATKAGIRGYADALRREVARYGIGVTYVAPRGTRTAMAAAASDIIAAFGMKLDPADLVARQAIRAVRQDARSAYPRGPERLFVLLQRLAPALIDRAIRRQLAAALRDGHDAATAPRRVSGDLP